MLIERLAPSTAATGIDTEPPLKLAAVFAAVSPVGAPTIPSV
jgi:hypothetical protein